MATETQKLSDTNPALENPKKTLDPSPVPPTATNPDRPEDPPTDIPSDPAPSSEVVSEENGSKADSEDPKTAAGSEAGDGAAPATAIQKKMRRAERFGISVQMTEEEKRNSRAERFGLSGPAVAGDENAKKKARLARFAPISKTDTKTDPMEDEKRRQGHSGMFSKASTGSLSQVNDKGNIEPAAIAGSAGGGV
ncbi:hypothetical protein GBA52_019439 [Prunus armeniaca]|nr:hypothetical protein GBA52_019439 [Prunus armeniaca]